METAKQMRLHYKNRRYEGV